jgi:hypothetical protein
MKSKSLITALALGSLGFAALLPPEAYPEGKMAVIVCATFAFLAALVERQIPRSYLLAGAGIFAFLLAHSLFVSVDPYRSIEFVTILWAYYCLFGFFMYCGTDLAGPAATTMVALSAIVAGYGLYQYFWGFDQVYSYIFYSSSAQVVKVPALERIATRRVFSTLALPGTLWGFLLMALPLHAILWRRSRLLNAALVTSMSLSVAAGFLTRSFGFLAGLAVLLASWLLLRKRRLVWNHLTALIVAVVLLALIGGAFYSGRRGAIEDANPLSLRFANWVSAWHIFATHPLGSGLNTYGVVYPEVMIPGANETQYTHNTALQLMAELGYPALIAALALIVLVTRRARPDLKDPALGCIFLALTVWAAHNAIDIDVYFPSVGAVGAVLCGLLYARTSTSAALPGRGAVAGTGVFATVILAFSGLVLVSSELQHRAEVEYEDNKPLIAAATLEQAKQFMPFNSSLFHDSGEILLDLSQKLRKPEYLVRATASFERAVALSPEKAGHHIGLGLCLSSAGNLDGAMEEITRARQLYPTGTYGQSIARLLEQRKAATP